MECINQSITHGVLFIAYILNTSGLTFWEYPKVCVNLQTDVR